MEARYVGAAIFGEHDFVRFSKTYSKTINKAQGQILGKKLGFDLRNDVFNHEQLYSSPESYTTVRTARNFFLKLTP